RPAPPPAVRRPAAAAGRRAPRRRRGRVRRDRDEAVGDVRPRAGGARPRAGVRVVGLPHRDPARRPRRRAANVVPVRRARLLAAAGDRRPRPRLHAAPDAGAGRRAAGRLERAAGGIAPVEHLEIPVGEMTFHALADGPDTGELVLLLHGFPQTSYEWREQLAALGAAGYR